MANISNQPINDANYLTIDLSDIPSEKPELSESIDNLISIQKTLLQLQNLNRLNEIPANQIDFYKQALHWLRGETQISQLVSVSRAPGGFAGANSTQVQNFSSYVTNAQTNFRNNQIYNLTEISLSILQNSIGNFTQAAQESIEQNAQVFRDDLQNRATEHGVNLNNIYNNDFKNLSNTFNDYNNQIVNIGNDFISRISSAQAMNDWSDHYDKVVEECKIKLYGKWSLQPNLWSKNWQNLKSLKLNFLRRKVGHKDNNIKQKRGYGIWRNIFSFLKLVKSKLSSYSFQRQFWFLAIIVLVFYNVAPQLFHCLPKSQTDGGLWYEKYILYLPILVVFGMAYSFAIKNYRICANRLEQYEHRATVAKTARGIITSQNGEGNQELRKVMAATAAIALFEQKTTGHLSKREAETGGVLEVAKAFVAPTK